MPREVSPRGVLRAGVDAPGSAYPLNKAKLLKPTCM